MDLSGCKIMYCNKFPIFILAILLFNINNYAISQNKNGSNENKYIKFIRQIPEPETLKKLTLKEVLFGKTKQYFDRPISLININSDNILIIDQGFKSIFNYNITAKTLNKIYYNDNSSLIGICSNVSNDIYITDSKQNKIFKLKNNSNKIEALNDSLKLNQPTGIAYSKINNEIWVVETNAHRISVLDCNGNLIKTIGCRGSNEGEFNYPTSIWIDDEGKVFVVDAMNFRVQVFDKNGKSKLTFGTHGDATGYFYRPKGIATDSFGNIYIAESLFNTVQIFDKNGKFVYNFGSYGNEIGEFSMPNGIFIDKNDNIYVVDYLNSRIQIFKLQNFD